MCRAIVVVYRPFPTSNHNPQPSRRGSSRVVYRPFPTSNHNLFTFFRQSHRLYIVRFLHQTTTHGFVILVASGCISSVSYIKPQHVYKGHSANSVVYRPFPTSNHNKFCDSSILGRVVYRPFPTSNHNCIPLHVKSSLLYIVRFLHQTTTGFPSKPGKPWLYIVRFLHQTTTDRFSLMASSMLYIVRFLHQTTTDHTTAT